MKFRFSLAAVLNVRKSRLEQEKQKLARLLRHRQDLDDQYGRILQEMVRENVSVSVTGSPNDEKIRQNHLLAQGRSLDRLAESIRSCRQASEAQRRKVLEADRQLRILERLKEKEHDGFLYEMAAKEQRELDEMATRIIHGRNK